MLKLLYVKQYLFKMYRKLITQCFSYSFEEMFVRGHSHYSMRVHFMSGWETCFINTHVDESIVSTFDFVVV